MRLDDSPGVLALREEFARDAIRDAGARRHEFGTVKETRETIHAVAHFFALEVKDSIMASVEMALDVRAATEGESRLHNKKERETGP